MTLQYELTYPLPLPLPTKLKLAELQPLSNFIDCSAGLLKILENEFNELQLGNIFILKTLLKQKLNLLNLHHTATELVMDPTFWLKLPNLGK